MYNRGGNSFEDPWVSIGNFPNGVVYAEDSTENNNQLLMDYAGMDVFIKKIRTALEDEPGVELKTIRGVGFKLIAE